MRSFQVGKFNRSQVIGPLRAFCPEEARLSLEEVDLSRLKEQGKKLILVDIDNTLLPWRSEDIPESTLAWMRQGQALGLEFCIISNTRNPARRQRLAEKLGAKFADGRFKPSKVMYLKALEMYGVQPSEAVMIGDQLLTDILGANRAGIEAIFVKPMHRREFVGTKFNRMIEWVLRTLLYNSLEPDLDEEVRRKGFLGNTVVLQFLKFCVVGFLSTVIDWGLHYFLMFVVQWNGELLSHRVGSWVLSVFSPGSPLTDKAISQAAFGPLKVLPVVIAILNSYFLNRKWTFNVEGKEGQRRQIVKFFAIALIGMLLNVVIASGLNSIIPGHPKRSWAIANAIATVIVVFWNFTGQRLWTFRERKA